MNCRKLHTLFIFLMFSVGTIQAQTDSVKQDRKWHLPQMHMPKLSLPKVNMPKVHLPKMKAPAIHMPNMHFPKLKMPQFHFKSTTKKQSTDSLVKKEKNQLKEIKAYLPKISKEELYLYSGINFSKQTISGSDYTLPFNYNLNKISNDVFKPGYFLGARWEGAWQQKHLYNLDLSLQKIATGTKYNTVSSLDPFIGEFVQHKADDQLFILSIAANYKKQIPTGFSDRLKLYAIAGPSIDIRLSNQSIDNNVTNSYKKILLRANLGLELDNNGYYTIFMHYKPSLGSFTKEPIRTTLNSFELGMMLNANDIF